MDTFPPTNILSKSRMEQHLTSLISDDATKVSDVVPKSRGSPARKPKAAKADPPALTLDGIISQPAQPDAAEDE